MVQGNDFDTYMVKGSNKKTFNKNMNIHFFDLTVKLYAFDFNTYDGSLNGVNVGCRVVP